MMPLRPLSMPLQGLTLIEASAGTGKTYTITTLYLRLLLERALEVDRILVVTFTEAATEELRDRIRRRVAQALAWLDSDIKARRADDPTLADLLLALPDPAVARTVLADALTRMDEAAIYTIHGFCQRMLQDNAFDIGTAFEVEFITDETQMRTTAIEDFWRLRVAVGEAKQARWVRKRWKTPGDLLGELKPTLALDDLQLLPEVGAAIIAQVRRNLDAALVQARQLWMAEGVDITDLLQTSPALNRRSYTKTVVANAIAAAEEVMAATSIPDALPKPFARLTPAMLEAQTKDGQHPPTHPFFDRCGEIATLLPLLRTAEQALFIAGARTFVREALARRKRDEGVLYFDDLLRGLDQALSEASGGVLADIIRRRYPVALVDEFQDTDPQQYRIFRRVYVGQPDCGLFIIGDPKQAIYAFRGADIFTYMAAREDSERDGVQYTLGTNRRSSSRLVAGVNSLFGYAQAPFIYEPYIGFDPVEAGPTADDESLRVDGVEPVPLQFWMLEANDENSTKSGFIRVDPAKAMAANACAGYIAELLTGAGDGQVTLGERALRPGDIALLVRTHKEGDTVQQALRVRGVNSVTLSQDSVFDSEEAQELALLLDGLAEINDEGRVRTALGGMLLGYDAAELERLGQDERAWEAILSRLQGYRERWQARGFMVAFQELLSAEGVTTRLLERQDGERRLTNLLQLAELLQVASHQHPGLDGLLRWFADQRAAPDHDSEQDEARQLRLESDEGLVKVITMHKSKGLEYPLVFIPFPWSVFKPYGAPPPPFFHADGDRRACLDLGSGNQADHRALEKVEQLAERLRLLYVAITRAAKLCVLCWGKVNGAETSAPAYLLHQALDGDTPASRMKGLSEAEIRDDLEALAAEQPEGIAVCDLPLASGVSWQPAELDREQLRARRFTTEVDRRWCVSSYSALVRGEEAEHPDHDPSDADAPTAGEATSEERNSAASDDSGEHAEPGAPGDPGAVSVAEADADQEPLSKLPAGPHVGQFLHEVFENVDFPVASGERLETTVRGLLARHGGLQSGTLARRGVRAGSHACAIDWTDATVALVGDVLDTTLDEAGALRLRDVPLRDRLTELEFHFPVSDLTPDDLRRVLATDKAYTNSARGLVFVPLRGLMRGFIDLVFRHDGRFYVIDYKSNQLGEHLSAYGHEGMHQAIRQHRYDLQYLIYTLALHRFLQRRVPDYDYAEHFGGVYYLFLRGMRPAQGSRFGVWHDRPAWALIERLDRLFSGAGTGSGSGEGVG